ncbi:TetR/AcrR family transcriptional regulator [Deinococcus sp. Leaf326]|uniref:TetR/AcrR family transcriptional regulator n=1 Tax=Deinococcus sp. Leaf326 TaxID=1736338 RepID=UPI00070052B2|nr:TetR/AcrR family transcriptional regulator [Deinococcus sp. Leaf326]KQR33010.1 hypothetical protein ASF71_17205 [Deinococcus sp. Leaf326]
MAPRPGLTADLIIANAAELADTVGLQGFTFKELAEKCGVKTPSLYNHVPSLEAVHQGLALLAVRELAVRMRRGAVGLQGLDALRSVAHAERQFARERPGLFAAIQRHVEDQDEELRVAGHELLEILLAVLRGYPLEGQAMIHAARATHAALIGFVLLESKQSFGLPTQVDASFEWLIGMLDAGLRTANRSDSIALVGENGLIRADIGLK